MVLMVQAILGRCLQKNIQPTRNYIKHLTMGVETVFDSLFFVDNLATYTIKKPTEKIWG